MSLFPTPAASVSAFFASRLACALTACGLALAHAGTPADAVNADISALRERHAAVVRGIPPQSPQALQAALQEIDDGLARLDAPLNTALARGHAELRLRRHELLLDKARALRRLGQPDAALAALEAAVRLSWVALPGANGQDADPDLAALLADPRAGALRNRLAVGPRLGDASPLLSPYTARMAPAERVAALSRLWATARQGFAWFDHAPELDWDAAYLQAVPRVLAARDTEAVYRELMRFTALLRDGHSNAYPPDELLQRFYARPGLRTGRVEGHTVVLAVTDPALERRGVRVGDLVLSVDGLAVDEHVARHVAPYQSSSTPQDLELRSHGSMLLAGDARRPVRLVLAHADGSRYTVSAPRSGYRAPPAAPTEALELRADGVAVLRAGQFENDAAVKLLDARFDEVLKARALVLDLRGNVGGDSDHGLALLSALTDRPVPMAFSQVRDDGPLVQARMGAQAAPRWQDLPAETYQRPLPRRFDGPVVMLVDAGTFSAGEDTAVAFKLLQRGRMLGSPTGGSTGQPLWFGLPGGGAARICVKRDSYPDGSHFVGVGVQPDLVVRPTLASVRAGQDPVLDAALRELAAAAR